MWNPGFSFGYTSSFMLQGSPLAVLVPGVILLSACSAVPEDYPPPEQRTGLGLRARARSWINMNDPDAPAHIVRDVSDAVEAGSWRWTFRRPQLKFFLAGIEGLTFVMEFSIAESTFRETGPVTLSFFVNGQPLDKVRYVKPGHFRFEKPVHPSMLRPEAINEVAIEPDKVWVSKTDAATLGFILIAAGFIG
jgi:hypothetical protein